MRKLYHCAGARSMRSLWLMHELGLEFELETLGFSMAALRTPDDLALSPLGRVPCLVDGELRLIESGAICQYLCERGKLHCLLARIRNTQLVQAVLERHHTQAHGAMAHVESRAFFTA